MVRTHLRRTSFLALAAGLPGLAQADIFTFTGTCNVNWYQECQTSPCGGGGWNTFNNWGKTGCNWGLPTPGAADTVVIGSSSVTLNGSASIAELQNAPGGLLSWISGDLTVGVPFENAGVVHIPGGHKALTGTLINNNYVLASGDWQFNAINGTIVNNALFEVSGNKQMYIAAGTGSFTNTGTLRKIDGGTLDLRWPIDNTGVIDSAYGTNSFTNTTVTSGPASSWPVGGPGVVRFVSCSLAGLFAGANAGLFQLETGVTIPANTTFAITGNGVNWSSGGIVIAGGALLTNTESFSVPGGHKQLNGAFRNTGTVTTHGDWQFNLGGGTITNDHLWVISGNKQFFEATGTNLFTNNATLRKTDGGSTDWRWPFVNNSLVDVVNGTFYVSNTAIQSGPASTWTVTGSGAVRFNVCSIAGRFAGVNNGLFQLENGTAVSADTTLAVTGNGVYWSNGTIDVAGGALLTNTAAFIVPGGHKHLSGAFRNTGTITAHGDWQWNLANSSFTNDGVLLYSGNKQCYEASGANAFTNNGALRKVDGGSVDFRWPTTNNGMIEVANGTLRLWGPFTQGSPGTTRVNSTLHVGGGQSFAAGVLEGSGTIVGPVTSGATVRPGGFNAPGTLTISGTFSQNADGILDVEIGGNTPGTEHDRLAITGNASLAGRIAVRFFNGLQPVAGSTYTVLTSNTRSGTFAQVITLDPLDGLEVAIDYTSTSVIVRVVACTPCLPCNGDVNCDGAVNGLDIEIQELAVGGDLTDYCQPDADFNHDGSVNGLDVEGVEQVVGGGFCP